MHLVNHVDLEACIGGGIDSLLEQLRHIVHTAIGCSIHFNIVNETPRINCHTGFADTTRMRGNVTLTIAALTIERFSQNARERSLANTSGAGEQVGMMQALLLQRVRKRTHDVLLPDQTVEIFRAIFAC